MKIIAHTGTGYIVEMPFNELPVILGYTSIYDAGWEKLLAAHGMTTSRGSVPVGVEVLPIALHRWIDEMQTKEKKVAEAAQMLHSLANMITAALPSVIIGPAPDPEDDSEEPF